MPLLVEHQHFGGVSWGVKPRVIALKKMPDGSRTFLLWVPGGTSYVDRVVKQKYGKSHLTLFGIDAHGRNRSGFGFCGKVLAEGGRLSKKLIAEFSAEINNAFEVDVTSHINLKSTLEI